MRRRKPRTETITIAGWLFADLLLGIAMLFLALNSVGQPKTEQATPTPTYTASPIPSQTPSPSPTATLSPSPTPTRTPAPTLTLTPSPTPTPVPTPTQLSGLQQSATDLEIEVDPERLLGGNSAQKTAERDRIRGIVRQALSDQPAQKAGMVITFGSAPIDDPTLGNRLAAEINAILLEEFPDVFDDAVLNAYHEITRDIDATGRVEIEIYWLLE